jgi:hypothetical protein
MSRGLHAARASECRPSTVLTVAIGFPPPLARFAPEDLAFPRETAPDFLLRDRDASYGSVFSKRVEAMGVTEVVTAPRSPWQNAHVERVIGSIRRECLTTS